jgi:hypothetical protein
MTLIRDAHDTPSLFKLAIGQLFTVADDSFYALDGSELTWDLSIDDQPVDLKAFGHGASEAVQKGSVESLAWNALATT